ncbi:hypothetical protein ACGF0J_27940 [Nonomuraea sp. NPDC047897]|uniref:hypothetical protein n=1 Tax=Nonomuraea sp. NPDC047897 TaxID=3364346 RepID=UPI00371B6DE9
MPDLDSERLLASGRRLISFVDTLRWENERADGAVGRVGADNAGAGVAAMRAGVAGDEGARAQTRDIVRAALATAGGHVSASFLWAALKVSLVAAAVALIMKLRAAGFFGMAGAAISRAAIEGTRALIGFLLRTTLRLLSGICRWLFERAAALLARRRAARAVPSPGTTATPARGTPAPSAAPAQPQSRAEEIARHFSPDPGAARRAQVAADDASETARQVEAWQRAKRPTWNPDDS